MSITEKLRQISRRDVHHIILFGLADAKPAGNPDLLEEPYECTCPNDIIPKWSLDANSPRELAYLFLWESGREGGDEALDEVRMPPGVGFRVGGKSGTHYLILQIHFSKEKLDESVYIQDLGVRLTMVPVSPGLVMRPAALIEVSASGLVGRGVAQLETGLLLLENITIHPLAYHVHTHGLGIMVSVWKVDPSNNWTLIAKRSPQLPQHFVQVEDSSLSLSAGDAIAIRCTYHNNRKSTIKTG